MSLTAIIGGVLSPLAQLADDLFTSDEERNAFKQRMGEIQVELEVKVMEHQARIVEAQSANIRAEATGGGWLQRNWRPLTMLAFVSLIIARWMGWTAPGMSEAEYLSIYDLIKIGLGGYVLGRTVEKVTPGVVSAIRNRSGTESAAP